MKIYKANFDTKEQGTEYLLNLGVLVETDEQVVFSKSTAAVVYIGKIVDKDKTTDPENPVFYDGYAIDVMSSETLDFGTYAVYPADKSAHSFFGYPKDAEVKPTKE